MAEWLEDRSGSKRLDYYAGTWDPANGNVFRKDFEGTLRWWTLFYDRIIVPDKYFCVYGPLYNRLKRVNFLVEAIEPNDPVLMLLKAGVIVPAITTNVVEPEISGQWTSSARGDHPKIYLSLTRDDGEDYIRMLKSFVRFGVRRPRGDSDSILTTDSHSSTFPEIFAGIVTREEGFLDEFSCETLPRIQNITRRGKDVLRRTCSGIKECVSKRGQTLARRHLEAAVFQSVSAEFPSIRFRNIYDLGRVDRIGRASPPIAEGVRKILSGIATLYQVRESRRWNAIGGLLRDHSPALVADLHGVDRSAFQLPLLSGVTTWVDGESWDISKIPFSRILEFRQSAIFEAYRKEAVKVQANPPSEQGFTYANRDFISFLTGEYFPAIRAMAGVARNVRMAETAKKATEPLVRLCVAVGMTGSANLLLQYWNMPGFGAALNFGGLVLTYVTAGWASVPIGRMVEAKTKSFLGRRLQKAAQSLVKSEYYWH